MLTRMLIVVNSTSDNTVVLQDVGARKKVEYTVGVQKYNKINDTLHTTKTSVFFNVATCFDLVMSSSGYN